MLDAYNYQQPPKPPVQNGIIKTAELQIERKFITVALKENVRGRFLRITEDGGGKRSKVIMAITGLDDFKRVINKMAKAAEEMPAPKTDQVLMKSRVIPSATASFPGTIDPVCGDNLPTVILRT